MAGDGKELNRTKLLAIEYGLEDRVIFPGLVLDSRPIISAADIYITLSLGRFTGISGIESALMGVPVLGIQLFSKHLVNSKDWIWSSNNPLNLANKIIQILKYPKEKKKTINKQRGYALLNCSTKKMSNAYYQLYKTLLNFSYNKINLNK
jgi:glycosyltransferase involved in cell wall biosynthesis